MALDKKLALVISKVFSIRYLAPLILLLSSQLILTQTGWLKVFLINIFFIYLLPLFFYLSSIKFGYISDWDISKREERLPLAVFSAFCVIANLLFFYFLKEKTLVYFYLRLMTPFIFYLVITFFWKISNHALANSFLILLLYLHTQRSGILYLGTLWIIIMGWARIKLNRHTLAQVIAGGLLPFILLI